jgi:seryl-tRNA synthetase
VSLRDALLSTGVLVDAGSPGVYGRSAAYEAVVAGLERLIGEPGSRVVRFPPVESRAAFVGSGYLGSFPDLLGSISTFRGDDRDHAALLKTYESGGDWTTGLVPADVVLAPAVCHPLYPTLAGDVEAGTYDVSGWVFRAEPSQDVARMQAFRQHDLVYVGTPDGAEQARAAWLDRATATFAELGIGVERVVANDPFFGRAGRVLSVGQRSDELKYELVCEVSSPDKPTAIGSGNLHRDHFGDAYGIRCGGVTAHSACFGYGLDRITLALLRHHGVDVTAWPSAVRDRLGL